VTPKKKSKKRGRTLTVLVVPANEPDEIDDMGFDERRDEGGGWKRIELWLDLDQGVYGSGREWDIAKSDEERCESTRTSNTISRDPA
jgi:hypothetical protein